VMGHTNLPYLITLCWSLVYDTEFDAITPCPSNDATTPPTSQHNLLSAMQPITALGWDQEIPQQFDRRFGTSKTLVFMCSTSRRLFLITSALERPGSYETDHQVAFFHEAIQDRLRYQPTHEWQLQTWEHMIYLPGHPRSILYRLGSKVFYNQRYQPDNPIHNRENVYEWRLGLDSLIQLTRDRRAIPSMGYRQVDLNSLAIQR
jgi:hypothetical protein